MAAEIWPQSLHLLLERFCRAQGETKGIKDFITVLMFYRDHKADEIETAVEQAIEKNISTSDGVHHILASCWRPQYDHRPLAFMAVLASSQFERLTDNLEVCNDGRAIDGVAGQSQGAHSFHYGSKP